VTLNAQSAARGGVARWWDGSVRQWSPLRRLIAGAVLIAAVFTVLQAVDYRQDVPSNDTYQYARQTLLLLGHSHADAVHGATQMFCQDVAHSTGSSTSLDQGGGATSSAPAYAACMQASRNGLTPTTPRYIAIFTSRPGYPALSAAFASVFGLRAGLWLTAMLCTLAASVLVLLLLRSAGAGVITALTGQALYLAAPTGYWGSRMLTDGPSLAATLLALLGAWQLTRQHIRLGAILLVAGLVTGFLIRYSSESLVAMALAVGAGICLWRVPSSRTRGMKWLAGLAVGGAIVSQLATTALGWPGITESMQDTFTHHFIRPDVSNPIGRLLSANLHFWGYFPVLEPSSLLLALGLAVSGVWLWRRDAVFAALVIVVAATGVGTVAAHPVASQADRLMVAVWLLIVLGVPLLASDLGRRFMPAVAGAVVAKEPEQAGRPVESERPEQPEQPYVAQSR
jgi:hypothetical protein